MDAAHGVNGSSAAAARILVTNPVAGVWREAHASAFRS
ncbi:hypothetical protein LI90_486 [Carbonactinospora thermoautotrophica]|uniref:Uncharacterized protein n=1 Tax=Carbonactinospora thermoautotrophica TaxID=1469144 RepID=A0A132MLY1_9ACTN|nr:hypothetical protein LI90_486 [Carbonactinospora thermoautotrophica]